jgi:hypothetical protein
MNLEAAQAVAWSRRVISALADMLVTALFYKAIAEDTCQCVCPVPVCNVSLTRPSPNIFELVNSVVCDFLDASRVVVLTFWKNPLDSCLVAGRTLARCLIATDFVLTGFLKLGRSS